MLSLLSVLPMLLIALGPQLCTIGYFDLIPTHSRDQCAWRKCDSHIHMCICAGVCICLIPVCPPGPPSLMLMSRHVDIRMGRLIGVDSSVNISAMRTGHSNM